MLQRIASIPEHTLPHLVASVAVLDPISEQLSSCETVAELVDRLGVSAERIRMRPAPGTAKPDDVAEVRARLGKSCELVDGVLVEKPVGYLESEMAGAILVLLRMHVAPRDLGIVTGEAGPMRILEKIVRIPDVAYASWSRFPGGKRPRTPVPDVVPDLVVEVLSESNTTAEMSRKRREYFDAGVRLVWEIDVKAETVAVYTHAVESTILKSGDTLTGGDVLPEFSVSLAELFAPFRDH